ncbi:ribonucleoside-diphosphate reductase subunit beta [Bacillus phage vB_BsuM-Goe16]|nr:ribonucleoside-diphosphate reductase subunit beta [Bacillus phage vB_BsuM-Goe16]
MERLKEIKLMTPRYPNRGTDIIGGRMSGIMNWNDIRYPQMYTIYKQIRSNFWIPQRISLVEDVRQFPNLPKRTQEAYLDVIGQLSTLDSIQTRLVLEFGRFLSEPTYQPIAANIAQQEATHEESYSYVLSSVVPDTSKQNEVFDKAKTNEDVLKRNDRVYKYYQEFVDDPTPQTFFRALVACVVLEGIYFYSAFTFFYNLARNHLMVGTSTMINYIQRDEVAHAYFFSQVLRYLMAERPELHTEENVNFIYDMMQEAADLEIEYSQKILHDIPGLDLEELEGYIKSLCNRRLRGVGLDDIYEGVENSMPWMIAFDDGSNNQTKSDMFEQKSRNYKKVDEDNDADDF